MRGRKRKQVKLFSYVATLLMIFSLLTPGFAGAAPNQDLFTSAKEPNSAMEKGASAASKISASLAKQFDTSKNATFIVKFKEQADTSAAANKAVESARKANLSAYKTEFTKRSAVISELKTTAQKSQANVLDFLEQEVQKGNAKDVEPFYIVNGIAVTTTKEVAEKLAAFDEVEKILPNEQRRLMTESEQSLAIKNNVVSQKKQTGFLRDVPFNKPGKVTAEEKKKQQAAIDNTTQSVEWNVDRVNAPDVWSLGYDGTGVVVAVIDTGVDWTHPALQEKYRGYDSATGEADHTYSFYDPVQGQTEPYDQDGHGTHVTGTIVGSEPDGSNQVGVAPGAEWIAVQAFTGQNAYDTDLIAAGEWIMEPGGDLSKAPDVVNNSWGGGPGIDEWYQDIVIAWRNADIFPVFAAGNTNDSNPGGPGSVASPANYPESFAVGATDSNDNRASFSLEGPSPYGEIKPDIAAPGAGIRSAAVGGGYVGNSGTSMAAPAVAGVVALLKQVNSSLTVDEMEQILMDTADSEAGTDSQYRESPNNGYGHGIIDAFAAVTSIAEGIGTVEGVVVMDGEDTEEPQLVHNPPNGMLGGRDLPLTVSVSDNVSITSVEIAYDGKTVAAEQVAGNYRAGDYSVTIPSSEITSDSFTYQWIVNDFGGNEVTSESYTLEITEPLYFHDFETEPTDWEFIQAGSGANSWEWGVPTSGPGSAVSGEKVVGTNLDGGYNNDEESYFDSPAISVPAGEAYLEFDQWYSIESGWDYGYLLISPDYVNWYILDELTGSSGSWEKATYDISEFSGGDVYLSYTLLSDFTITYPGWFIDNVTIADVPLGEVSASSVSKAAEAIQPSNIPLDATVSILETGVNANTNPADGSYSLVHQAGTYTAVAESYGFASEEQTVEVEADGTTVSNFVLEELEQATLTGAITNSYSGEPIADATVLLVEDANVAPVKTDANGNFALTAYEGTYTVRVFARDYEGTEVEVTLDGDSELNLALEPAFTIPAGQIGYDDGTAENALALNAAGDGMAVRMSLPEGMESAIVTEGVLQFWGTDFPSPGGTAFTVEVWSAGEDGLPDERIAGPVEGTAVRNVNQQTVVDLRDHNIEVTGDFFMVYAQTEAGANAPGIAMDENSPNAERTYIYSAREFEFFPDYGNAMIRANIATPVDGAVLDPALDGSFTNESSLTVEGTATEGTTVELLQNGEAAGSQEVGGDGIFAVDIDLSEGANELIARTLINGDLAKISDPVTVTLDTVSPDLTITNPKDGDKTDRETVTVEGTVLDENLAFVNVNGQTAAVDEDGNFSKRILLDEGENIIEVAAQDLAGNVTTEQVTLRADFTAPEISNLTPDEDQYLQAGDRVKIEFDSDASLRAMFSVRAPLTNSGASVADFNPVELPMMETTPGHYVAYWTVPSNLAAQGAVVEVKVRDSFGNETRKLADGRLYISGPDAGETAGKSKGDPSAKSSVQGKTVSGKNN
ncbi:S8 family serine peptidase [Ornithinibacillus contaminans]|uniref:S8 family serine peptidase n=1 Tax=Ornithinibacillus contaminans TaxID=694055 RepID=UPI00064DD4FB|nr:S8 family serine peptidase [Ornithinibacillus contaminans]